MEVGATLQKVSARQWMAKIEETCALLGGILAVINPAQYTAGLSGCIREIGIDRTRSQRLTCGGIARGVDITLQRLFGDEQS